MTMMDPAAVDQRSALLEHAHDVGPFYHRNGLGHWLVQLVVRGTVTFAENDPRGSVVAVTLSAATNGAGGNDNVQVRQGVFDPPTGPPRSEGR